MNENVEEQTAEETVDTQPEAVEEGAAEDQQPLFAPEEVTLTYPGFRNPSNEAEIHYEIASLEAVIKSLEARKAKFHREWTHFKLVVHLQTEEEKRRALAEAQEENSNE